MPVILLFACTETEKPITTDKFADVTQLQVFKQESCGCCGKWVTHMESAGFVTSVKNLGDLSAIKSRYGIEPHYQSCHTGVAEGYVFEGHIPASIIQQFLHEKHDNVSGLAVPGMPMGSPGMEVGDRIDSYDVLLLKSDGSSEVYAHIAGTEVLNQYPENTDSAGYGEAE